MDSRNQCLALYRYISFCYWLPMERNMETTHGESQLNLHQGRHKCCYSLSVKLLEKRPSKEEVNWNQPMSEPQRKTLVPRPILLDLSDPHSNYFGNTWNLYLCHLSLGQRLEWCLQLSLKGFEQRILTPGEMAHIIWETIISLLLRLTWNYPNDWWPEIILKPKIPVS